MSSMINDPEAIKKFRNDLLAMVQQLQEQLKRTDTAMDEVASAWKDEQFQKYHREFSKDRDLFIPLCSDIEEFESGPLAQLQSILETYNNL